MRLQLELDPGSKPKQGWMQIGDGPRVSFVGLLELLALVERATAQAGGATCADAAPRRPDITPTPENPAFAPPTRAVR